MRAIGLILMALISWEALASKARVNSLQGATHIVDTQTIFNVPSHIHLLKPYMTFEFGAAGADAEGGLMRTFSNGHRLMLYLGHQNTTASAAQADYRTANSLVEQNNPIEAIYGMGNMAFGASISNADNKRAGTKETSVVGKFGMNMTNTSWFYAHAHLVNQAESGSGATKADASMLPYLTVGTGWDLNSNIRVFGEVDYGNGKFDSSTATEEDVVDTNVTVGVQDRSLRQGAADIYYGIRMDYAKRDYSRRGDVIGWKFPAFLGMEYGLVDWATVRASVMQNVLFGQEEDNTATNKDKDAVLPDTSVAAGLGLHWKNLTLDGSLTAAGNGNINGTQFLSQASLTYTF